MSKKEILSVANNMIQYGVSLISTLLGLLKHRMSKQEISSFENITQSGAPGYNQPVIPLTEIVIGAVDDKEREEELQKTKEKYASIIIYYNGITGSVAVICIQVFIVLKKRPVSLIVHVMNKINLLLALMALLGTGLLLMNFVLSKINVKRIFLIRLTIVVSISVMLSFVALVMHALIFL